MSATRRIARLRATLKDVEPAVLRRLDVPQRIRLDRLHLVLQAAIGWTNSHLYAFSAGGFSTPSAPAASNGACPTRTSATAHSRRRRRRSST